MKEDFARGKRFDCEFSTVYLPLRVHADMKKLRQEALRALAEVRANKRGSIPGAGPDAVLVD